MITKVYSATGEISHDCEEAGCLTSWDGYIIDPDAYRADLVAAGVSAESVADLKVGDPADGRTDPGEEWDTSEPGVARLKA